MIEAKERLEATALAAEELYNGIVAHTHPCSLCEHCVENQYTEPCHTCAYWYGSAFKCRRKQEGN